MIRKNNLKMSDSILVVRYNLSKNSETSDCSEMYSKGNHNTLNNAVGNRVVILGSGGKYSGRILKTGIVGSIEKQLALNNDQLNRFKYGKHRDVRKNKSHIILKFDDLENFQDPENPEKNLYLDVSKNYLKGWIKPFLMKNSHECFDVLNAIFE